MIALDKYCEGPLIILRPKNKGFYSIEKLFKVFNETNPTYIMTGSSTSILDVVKNCLRIVRLNHRFVHISGDVYHILPILKLFGIKVTVTFHDFILLKEKNAVKKICFKFFWYYLPLRFSDGNVFISESIQKEANDIYYNHCGRVIYNLFDPPLVKLASPKIEGKYFVTVGSSKNKNIEFLVKSLSVFQIKIVLIGDFATEDRNFIFQNRGLIDLVFLSGLSENDYYSVISGSNGLLFPSLYEGFGLPPLEASYFNVPVMISSIEPFNSIYSSFEMVRVVPTCSSSIVRGFRILESLLVQNKPKVMSSFSKEVFMKSYFKFWSKSCAELPAISEK